MTDLEPEPIPPFSPGANPVRTEDGPQDVSQEPGTVANLARLLVAPEPPGAAAMLNKARSQLGTTARSSGWTPYGAWYAANVAHDQAFATADYCAMFQSWCAFQIGDAGIVGQFAYCPWFAQWYADRHEWGHRPHAGDLVFFNWNGNLGSPGDAEHVGIVESIRSDGRLVTIEANTTENGAGGPSGVWRRVRNPSGVVIGYGSPAYPNGPAPAVEDEDCWVV